MFKKLFSIQYCDKLILEMLKANKSGIIAANIIASLLVISVVYGYIPDQNLILWFSLHIILAISRLYIGNKLLTSMQNQRESIGKLLNIYIFITSLTALLFGFISFGAVIHNTPDINVFIIGIIIIALTAGSIATLGSIFILFAGFMFFSTIPFAIALIYHGGVIFHTFALILFVYFVIHILSGYRLFLTYQETINLEKKFKTIFDKSSDGITIIKNNEFLESNDTFIDIFGFKDLKNEFFQTSLAQLSPPTQADGKSSIKKMFQMLHLGKKKITTFEWVHIKKSGEEFWVEITLSPIVLNGEDVIHGVWRDIDKRKKAELEIKRLNADLESKVKKEVAINREKDKAMFHQSRLAQMGEMISMIAHQWRQPLAAISSSSAAINLKARLNKLDNNTASELSNKISNYVQHLSSTIDDFREFFKPNKEKKETTYAELIKSVLNIAADSLESKNIKVLENLHSNCSFYTYPNEIKQVILNLIKNAEDILIENEIKNPQITIETVDNILMISDNGGGIPKEIFDKIFDLYFSTKSRKDGTGLGLYMSKIIVEDHCNGSLSVSNNKEGAVFKITLGDSNG